MLNKMKTAIAGVAGAGMLAASAIVAVPAAQADPVYQGDGQVILAQYRGDGPRWRDRDRDRDRRGNWRRDRSGRWIGPAFSFGFAVQPRYVAPRYTYVAPRYAYSDADAWCAQRFRSFDPISNTYLGYDGFRHPCP
jgi:hypothetical protein